MKNEIWTCLLAFFIGVSVGATYVGQVAIPDKLDTSWQDLLYKHTFCKEHNTTCILVSVKKTNTAN